MWPRSDPPSVLWEQQSEAHFIGLELIFVSIINNTLVLTGSFSAHVVILSFYLLFFVKF